MKKLGVQKEQKEVSTLRPSKSQYYSIQQIEKQLYQHYQLSNAQRTNQKIAQKSSANEQTPYNVEEGSQSSKNQLKRMNSLKNHGAPYLRSKNDNLNSAKDLHQNKSPQLGKYRDVQHQKLTDKIAMIEQKVQEMKNEMLKKKQQKQKIIKQQTEERERLRRERYRHVETQPVERLKKRQQNPTAQQRIKKLSRAPYKQLKIQTLTEVNLIPPLTIPQPETQPQLQPQPQQLSSIKQIVTQIPEPKVVHHLTQNPYSPRSNVYYVSEVAKTYKDDKSLAKVHIVQSLQIMRTLENTRMPSSEEVARRMLILEQKKQHKDKKTLIFDLDQTLIHCNDNLSKACDVKISIKFENGSTVQAGINIRPYAKQILQNLSKHFQIIIFTASQSCYADEVLNLLDAQNQYISHRLYREHCFLTPQGMFVKDLRIINRPLSHQILVDNAAYSYYFQLENGIPIIPYYQGSVDFELRELEKYLMQMVWEEDVRRVNRDTFRLHRYIDYYNTPNKLVEDLYINKV